MTDLSIYEVIWKQGLEPEIVLFCTGLNWLYIIILTTTFYGMSYTNLLDWFNDLIKKDWWKKNKLWIASIINALIFMLFVQLEGRSIDAVYISSILRSMFFSVIFSNIFVNVPIFLVQAIGKFIDNKTKG